MLGLLWTIALNLPLGLGASLVARHGLGQPRGLPRGLAAAVLAWAWATLGMELLGSIGLLARGPLAAWSILGMVCGFALRLARPEAGGGEPRPSPGDPAWRFEATLAVGLALWSATLLGMNSLLRPVKVISDGPIYHLWFAARWAEAGRVFLVPTPFGDNVATYFPAVGDLWFAWLMIGWGGETLAKVGQAPFLLFACLAAYGMARLVGAGRSASVVAAAWLATVTPLAAFAFEANVDAILLAGYLAASYFFLRFAVGEGGREVLLLGGLAAGLSWGCKPTGLVFVPPLLGLIAVLAVARAADRREAFGHLAVLCAAPILTAGFWYARNAWLTGNPLYPLQVELLGRRVLTGWFSSDVMTRSRYYIPREDWRAMLDIVFQVLDPRLLPAWLAALAGAWAIRRPDAGSGPQRWAWAASGLSLLIFGLYWGAIPYRTQQRFMFPAVGLAAVPLALLLDRGRAALAIGAVLLAVHVLTPQGWPWAGVGEEGAIPWDLSPLIPNAMAGPVVLNAPDATWARRLSDAWGAGRWDGALLTAMSVLGPILTGVAAMIAAALIGRSARRPGRWRPRVVAGAGLAALIGVGALGANPWGAPAALRFYPTFDYYVGWLTLDRLAGPRGARIAYAGTNLPYFLLGPGMKNTVRYVNINPHPDWLMHDYHREAVAAGRPNWPDYQPGWDREQQDADAWLANLDAERIELLVVARPNPGVPWPVELRWAQERPDRFTPAYGVDPPDPLFRIFRLDRR